MKNWLIRTKNLHILGPVTKEKVKELYTNGSIKGEDEVSSGNGYWFYVKENDLIDRFLLSDEKQSFNPVKEAADILTAAVLDESDILIPEDSDLEYPDLSLSDDEELEEEDEEPDSGSNVIPINASNIAKAEKRAGQVENIKINPPIHRDEIKRDKSYELNAPKKSILTSNFLFTLIVAFLLVLITLFYFRSALINNLKDTSNFSIISNTYAQDLPVKKKE